MFPRKIISYLKVWKNKKNRKPLIIRGARQVGKTSSILMFGKEFFENTININLEKVENKQLFKQETSLQDFEQIIYTKFKQKIIPGKTLIFIDEIQNSPTLIKLLRFFYEEKPEWHVIASGSLLGPMIEKEGLSMPVGRIEYAYMYPLDFFEYLEAIQEKELLEYLKNISFDQKIPQGIHQQAIKLFYQYTMIGGMPEIVKIFCQNKNIHDLQNLYSSLFTAYAEDVYKYASSAQTKYIAHIIEKSPFSIGNNITYAGFANSEFKSREMKKAFDVLEKAMLVYQVKATQITRLPLIPKEKRPKKLFFLDVGLVNYQRGIQESYLGVEELNHFHRGEIAEQVVQQNILSQFIDQPAKIFYWAKPKEKSNAEIDFCFNKNGKILGIEVKSGKGGRLKSLYKFAESVENSQIIRIYSGQLIKEKIKIKNQKKSLLSLPFYLIPRIRDVL